jgi:hypothetical protein
VVILVQGEVQKAGGVEELTVRPQAEFRFTLLGAEAQIRSAFRPDEIASLDAVGLGMFELTARLADQAAVDAAIDGLRRRGVSISAMTRKRQTLEDAFLGIVQTQQSGRAPEIIAAQEVVR